MKEKIGIKSSQEIVGHYAPALFQRLQIPYSQRLPNIQKAKQRKYSQINLHLVGHIKQGNSHSKYLVEHYSAIVLTPNFF